MKIFAVIDTNVLVSAMLTRNEDSATVKVIKAFQQRNITLLYNDDIIREYKDVLSRPKFRFPPKLVSDLVSFIVSEGIKTERSKSNEIFSDPKDIVFYEVALSKEGAFLVTGNLKHFPETPIVVSPAEMVAVLESINKNR